jgi:hypothetical protein
VKSRTVAMAGGVVAVCASLFLSSYGIAAADPDVVGKQWGEAKGLLYQANLTPVIATVVGDQVEQAYCRVMSTSRITSRDSSGRPTTNQVQVNLSCYDKPASGKGPGVSAGNLTPSAQAIRQAEIDGARKWKQSPGGQKWCQETYSAHPDWQMDPDCVLSDE